MRFARSAYSAALAALLAAAAAGSAQSADFYKGKTLTIVVGFSPGGGYDTYARLLSRHFDRHIPGKPSIIVQNMPGAGSMTAVRHLGTTAPKDGTVMVAFNPGAISESLTNPKKVKFKFSDVGWVGSITRDFRVCYAWKATGIKSWDDLEKGRQFILGSTGKGTGSYVNGAVLRNVFGLKVKQITGFPGSAEQRLAVERGELDGDCGSWSSINEDWIRDKKIVPLVRFSPGTTADMPKDIPFIGDKAKTQEQKDLLNLIISPGQLGRPYIVSKEVPKDRLKILRTAFAATMEDPAFVNEGKKMQLPINPADGEEAEEIITKIYSASPELVQKAKAAID
jgi:tripartite-type tricarboxylate transporter receptor subunit TctC